MKQRTRLMHGGDDLINYNMNKKTDGDFNTEIQLHKMKPQEHFIEAQVQEGDTLQAIALRFYCSISELKRINQIHKDNEIFARRTIKVPVTPYSVLTEVMPTSQPAQPTPSTSTQYVNEQLNDTQSEGQNVQNDSIETNNDCAVDCNAVVLNSTMAPVVVPYSDTDHNETMTEDTKLLPTKDRTRESLDAVVIKELTSHGADFGLKWFHLVGFMLILGVIAPIVYIIFFMEKPEHEIKLEKHQY